MQKVTEIKPSERSKLIAAIESIKRDFDLHVEAEALKMKMRRTAYDAAIKEKFTPAEALELCKLV